MKRRATRVSKAVRFVFAFGLVLTLLLAPPARRSSAAPLSGAPFVSFDLVADSSTAIPGGVGTFTNFPNSPSIDGGNISVYATGIGGQQGIYRFNPIPPPIKVADLNTAVPIAPEGVVNFTGFSTAPVISGDSVAFAGFGMGGHQGIYRFVPPTPIRVADLYTLVPAGVGSFTGYSSGLGISGSDIVFIGSGSSGQEGVYLANTNPQPPPITPIADTNTEIPGGSGNFTRFLPQPPPITPIAPSMSGQYVVFFGAGGEGQEGVYLADVANPNPPPILPVADGNTTIPGGHNFQFFTSLASEGNDVAFAGGQNHDGNPNLPFDEGGVYKVLNVLMPSPPPIKVADLLTVVPAGIGNFTAFGSVAIDPGNVVFEGFSSDGTSGTRKGLYTDFGGTLSKIIATGDTLGAKVVSDLRFGSRGFSNHQVAFAADFTDGTHAVFVATLCDSVAFDGFHQPIGGADATGGTYSDPVRAFRLKSTVPVKMTLTTCDGQPLKTGVHTIQIIKFSNATTPDVPIDATPTDAATTGNEFRLTDAATGEWHFNLSTKSLSKGIWQIKATLSDGSVHTAFIELK